MTIKNNAIAAVVATAFAIPLTFSQGPLPPIPNAVISVAGGINGELGRTVVVSIKNPTGQYFVRGILNDSGASIPIGSLDTTNPLLPKTEYASLPIITGNTSQVLPGMSPIARIEVTHVVDGVSIERLTATCNPFADQSVGIDAQATNDQIVDGQYIITLTGNIADILSIGIGSYLISSEIRPSSDGKSAQAVFPANASNVAGVTGNITFTVCKKTGSCFTDIYKKKVAP